jgi:hypothetical protein
VQSALGDGIPHARADLRSEPAQNRVGQAEADDTGVYRFASLVAGQYTLKLGAMGFAQLTVRSIPVSGLTEMVLPPVTLSVADLACGGHAVLAGCGKTPEHASETCDARNVLIV